MNSPESENNKPENMAKPDASVEAKSETVETKASAVEVGGKTCMAWIKWGVAGAVVIGGVIVCTLMAPKMASGVLRGRMQKAGLEGADLKVESAGPFFARIKDLTFTAANGAVKVSGVNAMADYSPASVVSGGAIDDAIIENARVDVDLKALSSSSGTGGKSAMQLPFALPAAMDAMPAHGLLVRGAEVNVISGNVKHTMRIDALARMISKDNRSATISATGDNGDQLLLTLQPRKGGETINAEGSVDPLSWYIALASAMGKTIPQEVGLEAAPLVVQFAADIEGGKPGKWVWVVSQPWLQINNGPVIVSSQDARAGFTGDGEKLIKASAEGDLLLKASNLTVGPFHTSAKISDDGILEIHADNVVMKGTECSMTLDYCRLVSPASGEDGDLSLRGAVKPSWLPVELAATVTFSSNLDGMFVNMNLPRTTLKDVSLPNGWLPPYMNGMKVSGGIDADLYASVGGLSAGGFAASGRISSDNASFVIPFAGGSDVSFTGVRMRNARFSTSSKGMSIDIPDGFMAAQVRFGSMKINDFQLWPGRVSIPGDASLDSATANVFGGRMVVSSMRGQFTPAGVFVPSSPFEVKITGADLRQVSEQIDGLKMTGEVDVSARVSPVVDGSGNLRMGVKSTVEADVFTVDYPGVCSISAKGLDADFAFDNVSDRDGTRVKLEFSDQLQIKSFSAAGMSYEGKAYVGGWIGSSAADVVASIVRGPFTAVNADMALRFEGGDLKLPALGATLFGLHGKLTAVLGSDSPAISSDKLLSVETISLGNLKISKAVVAFMVTPAGFGVSEFSGGFCGGNIKLVKCAKEANGYAFTVSLSGVSATELAALFPQFKGKVEGVLDGELSFLVGQGTITIRPGEIHMREASAGRFSYPDADAIISRMGKMDEMVRSRAANTVGDMMVSAFSVKLGGVAESPVTVRIAGDAANGNGVPVDANVVLNGDVAKVIEMALGKGTKVKFAAKPEE